MTCSSRKNDTRRWHQRYPNVAAFILAFFLCPALIWAQTQDPEKPNAPAPKQETQQPGSTPDSAAKPGAPAEARPQEATPPAAQDPAAADQKKDDKDKKDDQEGKQSKRMFGVVPNFAAVDANTILPPLTVGGKFKLATQDSVDYSSFLWAGIIAGQSRALRADPELGHGMAGYGRYYWRAFADQASGSYFTEAIVPAITHEDPRYYTLGHGGFFRRTGYAISRVVVTKTDSGGRSFNYSEVVGNALEAGLSTAYYPPEQRGWGNTGLNYISQIEAAVTNNIFREFWPDIRKKFFRAK